MLDTYRIHCVDGYVTLEGHYPDNGCEMTVDAFRKIAEEDGEFVVGYRKRLCPVCGGFRYTNRTDVALLCHRTTECREAEIDELTERVASIRPAVRTAIERSDELCEGFGLGEAIREVATASPDIWFGRGMVIAMAGAMTLYAPWLMVVGALSVALSFGILAHAIASVVESINHPRDLWRMDQ